MSMTWLVYGFIKASVLAWMSPTEIMGASAWSTRRAIPPPKPPNRPGMDLMNCAASSSSWLTSASLCP